MWISISLYNEVKHQPDLDKAWQQMKNAFTGTESWKLWLVVLLMPVNWGIEAYKWYLLVNNYQPLSFKKAYESVLSGLSLSMNTPNRIGEYGGRIVYLEPKYRILGVALTLVSSVGQLLVTLVLGWAALLILKGDMQSLQLDNTNLSGLLIQVFQYLVLFFTLITAVFYFRMHWLVKLLRWIPLLKNKLAFVNDLENLPGRAYVQILIFSFLRFVVFALQYVLLWQALHVDIAWWQGFWGISLIFLIMAIVPSFAIAEIGIRGKVAVSIVGLFTANSIAVLAGTIGIWILNLVFPALIGSLLILTIRIFRER
ncbi:MAG: lysylphosphatidylglycerol synthase transmembrane domain-containing protein [Lacibacter sp.]